MATSRFLRVILLILFAGAFAETVHASTVFFSYAPTPTPTPSPSATPTPAPTPPASPSYFVNEGDGSAVIYLTCDRSDDPDPGSTVTVDLTTVPGSATEGPTSDTPPKPGDYTRVAQTVTFGPGVTLQPIHVPITDDSAVEIPEDFDVILFNAQSSGGGATLGNTTAKVTILDNDSTTSRIGFTSTKYQLNENPSNNPNGSSSVVLTVTRSGGDLRKEVDVTYATVALSATENVDYQGQSGTIVFASGQTSKTISIPVFNDLDAEGDESFAVRLSPTFGGISTATVTIIDDDVSTVSFSSSEYSVNEAAGNATITLVRTGNTSPGATVNVVTVAGTATADVDYVSTARSVTFQPGQTATTFDVPIKQDDLVEGTEYFDISLTARRDSGVVIVDPSTARVTVVDDEGANTVEFLGTDFSVAEANPSPAPGYVDARITVRLNRRGDPNQQVSVQYFTSTGSATPDQDYVPITEASNQRLVFNVGETVKTFPVRIIGDTIAENTETVGVTLANPQGALLGASSTATLAILDDDAAGTVEFGTTTYAIFENAGSVTLSVLLNRTGNTNSAVSVDYATVAGSATTDRFTPTSGTLTFAPGAGVATLTVPIRNDSLVEPPQSFNVILNQPHNAVLGTRTAATVTIQDDDGLNSVQFAAANYGVVETFGPDQPPAAVTLTVIAQRGGDPNQTLSVDVLFGASGDTAQPGTDYTPPTSTHLLFPPGISQQNITVGIIDRPEAQGTTFFTARLSNPGEFTNVGLQASTRVTIFDNSGLNTVQLLTGATRVREGDQAAIAIPVFRFGSFDKAGTNVNFTTEIRNGDTAKAGVNFIETTGALAFAPVGTPVSDNEHLKFIVIPIPDNDLVQGDVTFHVTLTSSDVAQLGAVNTIQVTVQDDDLGNVVEFSSPTYSVGEADPAGQASVTVKLIPSGDASRPTTVDYVATAITAYAGFDFSPVAGTLVFAPNETTKTILIPINNDGIPEPTETFRVTLSNPSAGAVIGAQSSTIVSILDDDVRSTIEFSPASYTVAETAGTITLTIAANRKGDPGDKLTVGYRTVGGTATAGQDFASASGFVTFGPGETQKTIVIGIVNDNMIEGAETFSVALDNPASNVLVGSQDTATVTIADDDSPTASIGFSSPSYDVDEGAGTANLLVTRSGGFGVSATVNYSTADGTAVAGVNYTASSGSITFAVGEVSKVIRIPIIDDPNQDPTLSFTVSLTAANGGGFIGGQSTATVNIIDNDLTSFRFNPADYTVDEGSGGITLIVEALRVGDPNQIYTVDYVTSDGSAVAGTKYVRSSGRVTFAAGQTKQTITIPIIDNSTKEGTEKFFVNLSNPRAEDSSGGTSSSITARIAPGGGTATVTIIDNDATTFQFSSPTYAVNDSSGSAVLTVTLSRLGSDSGTFTVNYSTSDITAIAGRDYTAESGQLTFNSGESSKTITIPLTAEPVGEPTRQFRVTLSNPSGGAIIGSNSSAVVSILNQDLSTKLLNISTRGPVQMGENVMIAGFIIQGNSSKTLVLRGIGPSLTAFGVPGAIADPTLTLTDANGNQLGFDDDYGTISASDRQTLSANALTPKDARESAIVSSVGPGTYTVTLRGKTNGVGLVEVYDISGTVGTRLVNISTRGKVEQGDNGALIAGFIVGAPENQPGTTQQVVIRAIGASLADRGVEDALKDPTLEIYRGSQKILENDNWKSNTSAEQQALEALGVAPTNNKESAIITNLDPGSYTAVIRGKLDTTGVALAEIYQVQQ
jgi:hypothetical protein